MQASQAAKEDLAEGVDSMCPRVSVHNFSAVDCLSSGDSECAAGLSQGVSPHCGADAARSVDSPSCEAHSLTLNSCRYVYIPL